MTSANWTAKVSTHVLALRIPPAAAGGSFNPGLQGARNALESHRRQPVDRSIPARASNNGKQRLGLNDPPAAAGGIAENITCVETLAGQFALRAPRRSFPFITSLSADSG